MNEQTADTSLSRSPETPESTSYDGPLPVPAHGCDCYKLKPVRKAWAAWIALLFISLAIRAASGGLGEYITGYAILVVTFVLYVFYPCYHNYETRKVERETNDVVEPTQEEEQVLQAGPETSGNQDSDTRNSLHKGSSDTKASGNDDTDIAHNDEDNPSAESISGVAPASIVPHRNPKRLFFLDNIKTFLTAVVVMHHVTCAFGACGTRGWIFVISLDRPASFRWFSSALVAINQSYFMPLFFFISAYFVPSSYSRKGMDAFIKAKRQRLLIPAMFITFLLFPACIAFGVYASRGHILYIPFPGHAWFLFWLLLLNSVYVSISQAFANAASQGQNQYEIINIYDSSSTQNRMPFPKTHSRLIAGAFLCGLCQIIIVAISPGTFACMPQSVGSLIPDLLMFGMGILAKRYGWLEGPISDKMDISAVVQAFMTFIEMAAMVPLLYFLKRNSIGYDVLFYMMAGVFCLDMSLTVIIVFQRYLNWETKLTKALARSAYTVYLIHPLVLCGMTGFYIFLYNKLYQNSITFPISNDPLFAVGQGGEDDFWVGWTLINVITQIIVWPISYLLTRLPILSDIL